MPGKGAQRSYQAFLRQVKADYGLTHQQAQGAYRVLKEKTEKPPTAAAARRNAAETRRAVQTAKTRITKAERQAERERAARAEKRVAAAKKAAATRAAKQAKAVPTAPIKQVSSSVTIRSLEQWDAAAPYLWHDAKPRGYHTGGGYGMLLHRVTVEIHLRVTHAPNVTLTRGFLREAVSLWAQTGIESGGVEIRKVTWKHTGANKETARRGSNRFEEARANMLSRFIDGLE